ncbi:ankyrin repeat domain-containing protein [Herbaspirillum sp. BH-1]|jgi:ankyrin repeat protein|uniref:Ankyrin repeat-containing signal peptide protein n=2 Tax=Herbaspirillum frisingense TaxID=92645 RepID=A0AAI9N2A0_9BURK|nr:MULTISPECIES: ankyrin repeat domain-containing protein [Herbaspirillum]EOA03128.1 ankyrin repeat-containing signal peptide protein [Herbaspirillum frisingense GSF30]MCI1013042.1 ankyrin repeat domain-containing protein [Herbaspirillum sp. C7C2]MDR6582632.1 ankyrin repeat protein [Herbaspirillum frisingense]PLY58183.1 ankyrin repeat domain-containing protein [Herbaspirillum sp. BH-1]QNB07742.1 ankyrin repeat domain-containing protein [Herbaspirillum frisingense]
MTLLEKLRSRWRGLGRIVLYTSLLLPGAARAGAYEEYFQAIRMDNVYFLKQLMQRGMGPNLIEPKRGYTGLMLSIREDSMKAFEVLVNAPDVNLEAQATNGDTPLMLASFYGNIPVVKLLLSREVEVNRPGWTALHYAAINGSSEIVKLLLDASAYVDAESPDDKMTPVMLAAMRGRVAAVEVLRDNGADLTLKNKDGLTAMDLARRYGQEGVIDALNEKPRQ